MSGTEIYTPEELQKRLLIQEASYALALKNDEEFHVLKDIKEAIKKLKLRS